MEEGRSGNEGDESNNNLKVCFLIHVISQIFDGIDSSSLTHMLPTLGYTMTHHHQLPHNFILIDFLYSLRATS